MNARRDITERNLEYVTKVPVGRMPGVAQGFVPPANASDMGVSVYGIGAVTSPLPPRDAWTADMIAAAKKAGDAVRATGAPNAEVKQAEDAAAAAVYALPNAKLPGATLKQLLAPALSGAAIGAIATCKGKRLKGAGLGALAAAGLGVAAMLVARLK